ncbi:MAG: hypothetical protein CVU56_08110, partial [Deltaproteobacteria bacterium HGW-Deltaproteobacteria-14]
AAPASAAGPPPAAPPPPSAGAPDPTDATGRLRALLARDADARDQATDQLLRDLDPKRADFGAQVDQVFSALGQDTRAMTKRVVLLRWLVEHDLRPQSHGYSRAATELVILSGQLMSDPDTLALLPGVFEYLMTWYPAQPGIGPTCRAMLDATDRLSGVDPVLLRRSWKQFLDGASADWAIAVRDNQARVRDLFTLCAHKATQAPAVAPPVAPDGARRGPTP